MMLHVSAGPRLHPAENSLPVALPKQAHRDIHTFTRRAGRLPEQREGDAVDFRSLLHRDGSVLSTVTLQARPCPPDLAAAQLRIPRSWQHVLLDVTRAGRCQVWYTSRLCCV